MPLPFIAIPVVHATAGWIAYGSTGYIAGTTAATATGAFIAGNATALATAATATVAGIGAWAFGSSAAEAATTAATHVAIEAGIIAAPSLPLAPIAIGVGVAGIGALALDRYLSRTTGRGLVARFSSWRAERREARAIARELRDMRAALGLS